MKTIIGLLTVIIALSIISCKKNKDPEPSTSMPKIENMYASRDTIDFGGDTATITVIATGGGLEYLWEVDLGDIFPIGDAHKILFTASACCIGNKKITCTVSNDKGEASRFVNIFIRQP